MLNLNTSFFFVDDLIKIEHHVAFIGVVQNLHNIYRFKCLWMEIIFQKLLASSYQMQYNVQYIDVCIEKMIISIINMKIWQKII